VEKMDSDRNVGGKERKEEKNIRKYLVYFMLLQN
jgi:hypothetical protein